MSSAVLSIKAEKKKNNKEKKQKLCTELVLNTNPNQLNIPHFTTKTQFLPINSPKSYTLDFLVCLKQDNLFVHATVYNLSGIKTSDEEFIHPDTDIWADQ